MAISYKRTIIQIPLKDVELFEEYAKNYGLSVSGAIVFLAKKSLEQEELIKHLPRMLNIVEEDQKMNKSKSSKKAPKKDK